MKKTLCIAALFALLIGALSAQDGSSSIYYDNRGYAREDPIWAAREEARNQSQLNMFQDAINQGMQQRRDLQRIEAEQAVERQRLQYEEAARQEELRIQRQQAELASQRNYAVTVYGTTLWRNDESTGLKDRVEQFTVTASSPGNAEKKGVELFKSKWKAYLMDDSNVWANAIMQ